MLFAYAIIFFGPALSSLVIGILLTLLYRDVRARLEPLRGPWPELANPGKNL